MKLINEKGQDVANAPRGTRNSAAKAWLLAEAYLQELEQQEAAKLPSR